MTRILYRCKKCKGCGLMKVDMILCESCKGKKCISCMETGYRQQPYIECDNCAGKGGLDQRDYEMFKKMGLLDRFFNPE